MNKQKYVSLIMGLTMIGSLALVVPVLADNQQKGDNQNVQGEIIQAQAIVGTVSAINGSTITVVGKQDSENTTATTTFTVDATKAVVTKNGIIVVLSNIVVGDTVVVKGVVTGTNIVATAIRDGQSDKSEIDSNRMGSNVVGKVSAVNGNILTVISKTTTFTVDATSAKLLRGNTAITLSDIAVDDNVVVQGTTNGTNIVATVIRDGKVGNGNSNKGDNNQALLQIQGNGQPVIAGTVSVINGSILTVANANVTYTVDAANAKIVQGKNTISLSGVKTGDSVIIQGTVNGTSVSAVTIIDSNATTRLGFFASIGQWFKHLFGF